VLLSLLTVGALQATCLVLPPGQDLADWTTAASRIGLAVVPAGQPGDVKIAHAGGRWEIQANGRVLLVDVPDSAEEREDIAVLAWGLADDPVVAVAPPPAPARTPRARPRVAPASSPTPVVAVAALFPVETPLPPSPPPVDPDERDLPDDLFERETVCRAPPALLPWMGVDARVLVRSSTEAALTPEVQVGLVRGPLRVGLGVAHDVEVFPGFGPTPGLDAWEGRLRMAWRPGEGFLSPVLGVESGISRRAWTASSEASPGGDFRGEPIALSPPGQDSGRAAPGSSFEESVGVVGAGFGFHVRPTSRLGVGLQFQTEHDVGVLSSSDAGVPENPGWDFSFGLGFEAALGRGSRR